MRRGRRRGLTPEDEALWARLKATVAPLHPGGHKDEALPVLPSAAPEEPGWPAKGRCDPAKPAGSAAPKMLPPFGSAALRMDRKRFDRMRRGQLRPEARIDLHGLTAERAHAALNGFIANAHAGGLRLVLVITGKGRSGDDVMFGEGPQGILRRSVPLWLAMAPNRHRILEISSAHRRHGGDGAYYVYLARGR